MSVAFGLGFWGYAGVQSSALPQNIDAVERLET